MEVSCKERTSPSIPHSAFRTPHSYCDVTPIDPGARRPHGGRQDRGRHRVGRLRGHHRRVRRCPAGVSGARHRHREAVPLVARPRAALGPRCGRPGGALQRGPLRPRRERLRAWTADLAPARLAHWAARLDRRFAGGGRQRAGRAVEVALLTGRGLSWWQEHARETGAMRPWYIQLTLPREALQRRIAERVDAMLAGGLLDEIRRVLAAGVAADAPGLDGVGYRE